MGQRLKSRSLLDLAYQVALIRPGVGVQGSSVSQFVERYRHGASWEYDHPLEQRALERGYGIIVWQEQVVQLIMDVAGFTAAQADEVRRAFAKPHSEHLIAMHRERFLEGAQSRGVPRDVAERIFAKINGHYMFPESHSHALAVPAYQATWLKRYYPLEFFVTLMNNQPMSFYPLETLKEDAKRFGLPFLNPCVNLSQVTCSPDQGCVLLGLQVIKDVGERAGKLIVEERERHGLYKGAGDLVRRTGLKPQAGPVLGDGWGLRQHHSQPPRGPLGCRAPHPSPHKWAIGHTFEFTFSLPKPRVEPTPEQIEAQKEARRAYEQKRNQTPERKELQRRVAQERRDKARLLGICVVCGAPPITDNIRCETCAEKHRVSKRLSQRRARQRAAQQETQASGQTRIF